MLATAIITDHGGCCAGARQSTIVITGEWGRCPSWETNNLTIRPCTQVRHHARRHTLYND